MTVREYALFSILPAIVLAAGFSFTIAENRGDTTTPTPVACPTVGPVPGSCDGMRLICLNCHGQQTDECLHACAMLNRGQTCGQPLPSINN